MPDDPILDDASGAVGTDPQLSPDPSQETSEVITLNRRELHKEIARLQREDPEFANAFNTQVGNKAKRQYQPLLEEARAREELLRQEVRRNQILALPEAEITRMFASDPAFAKEYADLVHRGPEQLQAETSQRMEQIRMVGAFEDVVQEAAELGLSRARIEDYAAAVRNGHYDKDPDGNPYSHWALSINALRDDMRREATTSRPGTNGQEPAKSRVSDAGPDLSLENGSSTRGRPRYANATQAAALFAENKISAAEYREAKAKLGW